MWLSSDTLSSLVFGKLSVTETDVGYVFDRFTSAQKQAFACKKSQFPDLSDDYFLRNCDTDTGILADMLTDASSVNFRIAAVLPANGSDAVSADILVDGRYRRTLKAAGDYTIHLLQGPNSRLRRVSLLFPYFSRLILGGIEVPNGCMVRPIPRNGLWLAYGDSITHGVYAFSPYRTYIGKLAVRSGYEILNHANSGYVHDAATISALPDGRQPDIITVAYGINDWFRKDRTRNRQDMCDFYERLTTLFPHSKIMMISPIWALFMGEDPDTAAPGLYQMFREVADLWNGRVILTDGMSLVPHDSSLFYADGVHPANAGFAFYARRLMRAVEKYV